MQTRIIVSPLPSAALVAVLRGGRLISLFEDRGQGTPFVPGTIALARVDQVFPDHQLIACNLDGVAATLRWGRGVLPKSGDRLLVTVAAESREGKPLNLRRGAVLEDRFMIVETGRTGLHRSRRLKAKGYEAPSELAALCTRVRLTLRQAAAGCDGDEIIARARQLIHEAEQLMENAGSSTPLLRPGPDALATAEQAFPDADVTVDETGNLWAEADIDNMIDDALLPQIALNGGGVLHINTPPGAAVFDGDSGKGEQLPLGLARAMVDPVAEALMLRRISGPVVVDFPRLDRQGMKDIDRLMHDAVAADPLHPVCHGFTPGGLYTLTRPWRWQPLSVMRAPTAERYGRQALRQASQAVMRAERGMVLAPTASITWLSEQAEGELAALFKSLARRVEFRSDNAVTDPVFVPAGKKG